MKIIRYSRWDGSQAPFSLDARAALDALAEQLMEGLGVEEALAWMQRQGFQPAGASFRVIGVEELLEQVRQQAQELLDRYHLDDATRELEERLEAILDREERAQRARHGLESAALNRFLERRHGDHGSLVHALEAFRHWEFADEEAGRAFRELLDEVERLRQLERFREAQGGRFHGREAADYETAQALRQRLEALETLARELAAGRFQERTEAELRGLLSEDAVRSWVWLRDLEQGLREGGWLREGPEGRELTPRAIRRIGAQALAEVYSRLRKGRQGGHETVERGAAWPRPDETQPWRFGDPFHLHAVRTLLNGVLRTAAAGRPLATPVALAAEDLEIHACDFRTEVTTVLLLDMSWSMSWAGRFPAAKRVALALDHLIRTRFPRDHFSVVGFSTRARELSIGQLPLARWDMNDPFTNLQEGLMLAQRLIAAHPSPSPQVLVITDGQPTAYFEGRELRVEWPMGFGGASPHAVAETLRTVRGVTRRGITINTFMLDDAPELVGFVQRMTEINKGRAFFTSPSRLGSFVTLDYLSRRRTPHRA